MLINFGRKFDKQYQRADAKIKAAFDTRLKLFQDNPLNLLLDNHSLTGNHLGKRSINITGDWRAIYTEAKNEKGEKIIIFHLLGTHSQLYK